MAERYSRLFTLPQDLYNEGSPVLIAAGALLKDNVTGAVLAQLKLKSLSEKTIKAVTVGVVPLDTAGRELSEAIVYNYLDLNVQRNAEFGQKKAISLPDSTARSFKAYVSEVIFDDNSIYSAPECDWTPLDTTQVELETELGNDELIKQFRMTYGNDYRYLPKNERDLWLCACGAVNHAAESKCHNCGREHFLFESLNINAVKNACEERLEAERIAAEKAAEERRIAEEKRRIESEKRRKEAEIAAKKRNKIMLIVTAAACACIAIAILLTQVIIPSNKYNNAVALMNEGKYEEAIASFGTLDGYKDSSDEILNCEDIILKNAEVGDYVWFGSYEQDNDTSNGKEGIEWLVLDKQGNKVLLLSRYGLDAQPYNTEYEEITWENCTLRTWLNETFINNAFSSAEQQRILLTDVYNSRSQCCSKWNTTGGNNTQDKIFLLSYAEANKYLDVTYDNDNNTKSRVAPTDYAIAQGAWQSDDFKTEDGLHAGGVVVASLARRQSAQRGERGMRRLFVRHQCLQCQRLCSSRFVDRSGILILPICNITLQYI